MKTTFSIVLGFVAMASANGAEVTRAATNAITVPLKALSTNPNYFTDGSGKAVYLTGSHTWNDFQDWGTDGTPQPFDFAAYVKMLVAHHIMHARLGRPVTQQVVAGVVFEVAAHAHS